MLGIAEVIAATRRRIGKKGSRAARLEHFLLLVSLVSAVSYQLALPWRPYPGQLAVKVLAIAPLGLVPLVTQTPRRWLLSLALLAGLCGDICLVFPGGTWFLRGLLAFLLGHLLYIVLFSLRVRRPLRLTTDELLAIALLVGGALAALAWLWPGLSGMRLPVVIYAAALLGMNISALLSRLSGVFAGALLFLLSDTLLGIESFRHLPSDLQALIWMTYYAALALIVSGYLADG
jgi:uncharacterized membrane protein YhhN